MLNAFYVNFIFLFQKYFFFNFSIYFEVKNKKIVCVFLLMILKFTKQWDISFSSVIPRGFASVNNAID